MEWSERKKTIKSLNESDFDEINLIITLVGKRKKQGITQAELAKAAGLSHSVIEKMEKEGVMPKVDILDRVSRVLGMKLTLIDEESSTSI